jgi:predicted MFS family arabinose efflux permease
LPRFLAAAGISFYGDWLTTVALVVLLFRVTGSAVAPAIYMLARVAPRVLGPTPGGTLADRFDPSRVAAVCALTQGAFTAVIVLVAQLGLTWAIYVAVAGAQFVNALSQPAYGAILPRLAAPQSLGRANGLLNSLFASSILVSPAIGALLLPHTTPETLIAIDAATFVIAALILLTLRIPPGYRETAAPYKGALAGLPLVRRDAVLRSTAAGVLGNFAVITALQAVLVVIATQHFGRDVDVGWLYASVGGGGVLGSIAFLQQTPHRIQRSRIVLFTAIEITAASLMVFVLSLPIACLLLFASSLSGVLYQTLGAIALQQRTPTELLGRTTGVMRSAMYVGMLLGAIAAVALVEPLGSEATVLVVCAAALALLFVATITGPRRASAPTPISDIPE